MPEGQLLGRTALITGSASGIGNAIATLFAAEGASVTGLDRANADLNLDLADTPSLENVVRQLPVAPDILVNCAGVCFTRPLERIDIPTAELTWKVNVAAPMFLIQAVSDRLRREQKPGVILNIASNSGFMPKLEQLDYGASKAALISITRSAALSLAPFGIRVNAIAPGVIDTPLTQSIARQRSEIRGVSPGETLEPVLRSLPMQRMGTPEEVAEVALFLASHRASYVTGQTILVDGGQLMR